MAGIKRVLPFLLLGPITGPIVAGVVFNFREGRPVLAGLYAILLVTLTICLPVITANLGLAAMADSRQSLQLIAQSMGIRPG
jgi:hypothetical protein